MQEQFSRTELIIGKTALNKLQRSRIAIFGVGGVGGHAVEALVRSGVGNIDIIDSDKICLSNLNRQIFATRRTLDMYKVDAARERLMDINPELNIKTYQTFFLPENADDFDFHVYDYVIDAIDTVAAKIALIEKCKESGVPIICSMGAGNKMHPEMFEVADISKTSVCPLARVIRTELKKRKIKDVKVVYSKEVPLKPEANMPEILNSGNKKLPPGSNAFVPSAVGLIIAGEVIRDLIK